MLMPSHAAEKLSCFSLYGQTPHGTNWANTTGEFYFPSGKTVAAPRLSEKEKLPGHRSTAETTCLQKVSPRHPQVTEQNVCTRVKLDQVSSAITQMPREPRIQRACKQVPASSFTALKQTLTPPLKERTLKSNTKLKDSKLPGKATFSKLCMK